MKRPIVVAALGTAQTLAWGSSYYFAGDPGGPDRTGSGPVAYSAVRGLAILLTDGPLRGLTPAERDVIGQRLLDMVEKGL